MQISLLIKLIILLMLSFLHHILLTFFFIYLRFLLIIFNIQLLRLQFMLIMLMNFFKG